MQKWGQTIDKNFFLQKTTHGGSKINNESPSAKEAMRKLNNAGEPVRAIEGGGKVSKRPDSREFWLSESK